MQKADKIATGILYAVSGVIVLILAALLIYILAEEFHIFRGNF